jgi:polyisoprenyl-phosphate glycosyltransferase
MISEFLGLNRRDLKRGAAIPCDLNRLPAPESSDAGQAEPMQPLPFPLERRRHAPLVSLVIPTYNEEDVLQLTYARIVQTMETLGVRWSITFVNDGSTDGTLAALERMYARDPRVSYVALARNFGHQAALAAGLSHADGNVVITMDADLQHPPELIALMLAAWRRGFDVVHTRKLATRDLSPVRSLVTRVAYKLIRRVADTRIVEQASDFRLMDRDAVDAVKNLPERSRLYRGLTPWIGFRQAVVPFTADVRQAGSSQYGFRQLLSLFSRSFFDFSRAPLQCGLLIGGVAIALCFTYLAYVLAAFLFGHSVPPGYVTLVFTVVFLSSVNLFFAGILGVYVARIYDEVRGRPTYVVGRLKRHRLDDWPPEGSNSAFDS